MLDVSAMFDRDRSRRPPLRALGREAWALATYRPAPPPLSELPDGAGRPVLVVPAFLTSDNAFHGLRRFLGRCGFRAFGWELGVNWGPTPRLLRGLEARLLALAGQHGPVALLGVSLGGLLARDLAHRQPAAVGHVLTVASPFRLPTASWLEPLVRLCALRYSAAADAARLARPLPMPSTMLFTADDGIVPPESCWADEPGAEVVALHGPHLVLPGNTDALRAMARCLAPRRA